MKKSGDKDRRAFVRISVETPVKLYSKGGAGGDCELALPGVFARDMSTCGLGIIVHGERSSSFDRLSSGADPVEVELEIPGIGPVRLPAEVVWSHVVTEDKERRLRAGLRFIQTGGSKQEILERFVRSQAFGYVFPSKPDGGSSK